MDPSRFDRLVKALTVRRPRRVALPLLAVLGLGLADVEESWAAKSGRCKPRWRVCALSAGGGGPQDEARQEALPAGQVPTTAVRNALHDGDPPERQLLSRRHRRFAQTG